MTDRVQENRALLLGASGFLGPALSMAIGRCSSVATHFSHAIEGSIYFDACRTPLAQVIASLDHGPAVGVILFGETRIDYCAKDPVGTAKVNVQGAIRAIDEMREMGIIPVFISSDAVFGGNRSWWSEEDETAPILTYGKQKLEVERHLARQSHPWLIVRLPKLLAVGHDPRCMMTGLIDALGREERLLCATDQFFTPAAAIDAANAIAMLIREKANGVFHLGGPERLSRRELLEVVIDMYRKFSPVKAKIVDCSMRDIPVLEARPLDTSLSSHRFSENFAYSFRGMATVANAAVSAYFDKRGLA